MQRRSSVADSQQLIRRARNAMRYVQTAVLPASLQRINQSMDLLSRAVGRELQAQQRVHDPVDGADTTQGQ